MRGKWIAAAVALLGVFAIGATAANAASLKVSTNREVSLTSLQHCAAAMNGGNPVIHATAASGTTVSVGSVPAACVGLTLKLNLHNSSGTIIATATTASAATTQTLIVGTYASASVSAAIVTLGGWIFPTSWNGAAPITPGCVGLDANGNQTADSCVLTIGTVNSWTANGYKYSEFQFSAVTAAPLWKVTFDFSDTSTWLGFTPVVVAQYQNVALAPDYSCSSLPVFQGIEANPSWNSSNGDIVISDDPTFNAGTKLCG